ncbi:hypothetical protein L226DRAFT_610537 [Lentinus tigrinus ALCF2SS1-7]|uniref:uncharacterized protein n=1 Tax=Lentinus tigrinus ALCF2SS1-7 TaxID=1328758 RepID=UPI001165DAB4|nr:hypothetical protein L226DRAFT_610537 [Lentinus tigrinus ALCF2SS1-7]
MITPSPSEPEVVNNILLDVGLAISSKFSPTLMVKRGLRKELKVANFIEKNVKGKPLPQTDRDRIRDLVMYVDYAKSGLPETTWKAVLKSPAVVFRKSRQYLDAVDNLYTEALSISSRAWIAAALSSGQYDHTPLQVPATATAHQGYAEGFPSDTQSGRPATLSSTQSLTPQLVVRNPDDPPPPYESIPEQENPLETRFDKVRVEPDGISQVNLHFGALSRELRLSFDHRDIARSSPAACSRPVLLSGTVTLVPRAVDTRNLDRDSLTGALPEIITVVGNYPQGYDVVITASDMKTLEIGAPADHSHDHSFSSSKPIHPGAPVNRSEAVLCKDNRSMACRLEPKDGSSSSLSSIARAHSRSLSNATPQDVMEPGTEVRNCTSGSEPASKTADLKPAVPDRSAGYLYGLPSQKDDCSIRNHPRGSSVRFGDQPSDSLPAHDMPSSDLRVRVGRTPPDRSQASSGMRPAPGYTPRDRSASSLCPLSPPAINLVPEIRDPVVGELLGRTRDINIRGPTLEERGTRGRSLSPLPRRGYVAGDHFVTKDDLARCEARVSPRSAHTRSISHTFPDSHSTIYNGQQWMLTRVVPETFRPQAWTSDDVWPSGGL